MKPFKFALWGVLAAAGLLAAVRSVPADWVDLWIIYDVKPWLHWDGKPSPPPVGEGLKVVPKRPNIDA